MTNLILYYDKFTSHAQRLNWIPLLVARLSVGSIFILSGWGKVHNLPKVIAYFTELGVPHPDINAPLVAGTELGCGSLIFIGLFTRFASIPLTITMVVAILTAKVSEIGSAFDLLGMDEFLYIVFFALLIVNGPGKISVDHVLSRLRMNKP